MLGGTYNAGRASLQCLAIAIGSKLAAAAAAA